MSEETQVQHRFVQIYALTAEETEKVWTVLAQPSLSPIAVSNACNKLISSVQRGKLNLVQTMVNIQTLVLTSSELKLDIFLRTLSELILIHVDKENEPFVISKTSAGVVQPFITLLRQAPQLYNSILLEIDHLIPTLNTIDSLVPFFDFVLFAGNVDSSALLTRLTRLVLIPDDSKTQLVESIFYYLLNVTVQYPTQQKPDVYFNIVDTLLTTLRFSLVLQVEQDEDKLDSFANDIFYQLVHRALNAADQNKAVIGYLNRIQHLLSIRDLCTDKVLFDPNFNITWACFSYLLLKAQTFDDQTLILQLMVQFARDKTPLKYILWVAYLPLFQTLSELLDSASEAKSNVLTLISFLDDATHTNLDGVDDDIKEVNVECCILYIHVCY
jgi:hypothetical protein